MSTVGGRIWQPDEWRPRGWMARVRRVARLVGLAGAALVLLTLTWLLAHVYLDRRGLPDFDAFVRFDLPGIGEVYDSHGHALIQLAHEYRRPVSYDEIPEVMQQAILSAEDKGFFSHSGVDYTSFPRVIAATLRQSFAIWSRYPERGFRPAFAQGGSTLTQQLVRGYFLRDRMTSERSSTLYQTGWGARLMGTAFGVPATNKLLRKLEEMRLAFWLEREMQHRYGSKLQAKREILARYASFIYLGHGRYGFAASSEYYFGRPLASFSTADAGRAALLAGMAKSPGTYAPGLGPSERAWHRRNDVLRLMARNGQITVAEMKRCQRERVVTALTPSQPTLAPAVIAHVLQELQGYRNPSIGAAALLDGRISIQSTVDTRIQTIVNRALEDGLANFERRHPSALGAIQGSIVVLRNADGGVLAEAGGRRIYAGRVTRYSDLNRVTGSLRQPGSTFKPIVYFAAFESGLELGSQVPDAPIGVELGRGRGVKWITNYDDKFKGPIPIRMALAESRNAVAIWLARGVGMSHVLDAARELGIETPLRPYVTTALGASEVRLLELANLYRALASGIVTNAHVVERVVDASGGLVYQAQRSTHEVPYGSLVQIQEGLRGVIRLPDGTAHALDDPDFAIPVMGKTGTTSDFRDALFVGSTYGADGITVAVRIGFDDDRPLGEKETGARVALPVFRQVMQQAYANAQLGPVPVFPREIEDDISAYLTVRDTGVVAMDGPSGLDDGFPGSPARTLHGPARVGNVAKPQQLLVSWPHHE